MNQDNQNMQQPLNEDGKKKKMNKAERKQKKHAEAISTFSLATHS